MFGIKTAKKVGELSLALVKQSEQHLQAMEAKVAEMEALQVKAATARLMDQFRNFNTQIFPHYNVIKEQLIYQTMDDIYSVVSRIATTAAMIPFDGQLPDGTKLKPNDKLYQFIETLTFEEKEKFYTVLILQGECFAYKEIVDVGVNAGLQRLVWLNPANMVVMISQGFPTRVVGYRYYDSFNGFSKDFELEEIFFVKTFNPTTDIQKQFRGLGLTTILMQRLTRMQSEMDTSVAQIQNGGLPGIVYEKTPSEVGAAGQRRDNFARFLNNSNNKGAPYFSNGDLGYFAIGSSLADMDLAALAEIDFDKICNACSVSSILFNSKAASTHANVEEMRKDMFTNAVIPWVKRLADGMNDQVVPLIKTAGKIYYDITGISELREDLKKKAEAFSASPMMKPNDVIVGLGGKADTDPAMDKWYIKNGYTAIDEINVPPLDNNAGDYTAPVVPAAKAMGDEVECPECKTKNLVNPSGITTCKSCKKQYLAIQ